MAEHVAKLSRRESPVISFMDNEARRLIHSHTDALVVTLNVTNGKVFRILIDTESSVDILFASAFCQMNVGGATPRPIKMPLYGFGVKRVYVEGAIQLPMTFNQLFAQVTQMVDFLLVDQPSAYNAIIGQPTFNAIWAIVSTYHLGIKFLVGNLVGEVRGDQTKARQCYAMSTKVAKKHKMLNTLFYLEDVETLPAPENISHALDALNPREKEIKKRGSPIEELESIKLDNQHLERTVQIGLQLLGSLQDHLMDFLKQQRDMFAWSHKDMPSIDLSITVHMLNIDPTYNPVIQKYWRFNPEWHMAINEEVGKLRKAKFIREAHYPE